VQGAARNISLVTAVAVIVAATGTAIVGRPVPQDVTRWNVMRGLVVVIVVGVCLNLVIQIGTLSRLARKAVSHGTPFSSSAAYVQLGCAVLGLLFGLTLAFWTLGDQPNACTSQSLGVGDSLYFTMTVITSTGFGDIVPATRFCRNLVTVEMASAFLAITVGLSQLIAFGTSSSASAQPPDNH
jgi:hypothetical protein